MARPASRGLKRDWNLLLAFAKAEFKMQYQGSMLGLAWYLIEPLIMFGVLYLIFSRRLGAGIEHYAVYLFIGIIQWHFLQTATGRALKAVSANGPLIKSVNFRRELVVIAPILVALVSYAIQLVLLTGVMVFSGVDFHLGVLLPIVIVPQVLFAVGASLALSSISVFISDLTHIWSYVTRLWWVATPIFYATTKRSALLAVNTYFNPEYQYIKTARDLLLSQTLPSAPFLLYMLAISVVVFIAGYAVFNRLKHKFPEMV